LQVLRSRRWPTAAHRQGKDNQRPLGRFRCADKFSRAQRMIRSLALCLVTGMALLTTTICRADEVFPVVHNEPISIRVLGGKNGLPLAHLHLVLIAGYDQSGLRDQLFREEAITNAQGQAQLSNQLTNLPWLQVWVNKKPLCQANPRKASFSMERIRRDGLSAPNRCGTITVEDAPGVFTVFVKGKGKAPVALAVATAIAPAVATSITLAVTPTIAPAAATIAPAPVTSIKSAIERVVTPTIATAVPAAVTRSAMPAALADAATIVPATVFGFPEAVPALALAAIPATATTPEVAPAASVPAPVPAPALATIPAVATAPPIATASGAPAPAPAPALAPAPATSPAHCSCAAAKKTSRVASACDRVGHVWDSFARSFSQ